MRGVAKITISPKSEFYHFLTKFWRSFWNQNLPKMALGLAMGRPEWPSGPILGVRKLTPKKYKIKSRGLMRRFGLWLPLRLKNPVPDTDTEPGPGPQNQPRGS